MNTFKYRKGTEELFIDDFEGQLRITVTDEHYMIGITFDRVGLDALRNYLDDLEMEE